MRLEKINVLEENKGGDTDLLKAFTYKHTTHKYTHIFSSRKFIIAIVNVNRDELFCLNKTVAKLGILVWAVKVNRGNVLGVSKLSELFAHIKISF